MTIERAMPVRPQDAVKHCDHCIVAKRTSRTGLRWLIRTEAIMSGASTSLANRIADGVCQILEEEGMEFIDPTADTVAPTVRELERQSA